MNTFEHDFQALSSHADQSAMSRQTRVALIAVAMPDHVDLSDVAAVVFALLDHGLLAGEFCDILDEAIEQAREMRS